jgi:phosphate transport system substrate-binding protein
MRISISKATLAALLVVPFLAAQGAAAGTLKLGGTGAAAEMLRQVGVPFTAASEIGVTVIPNLGSAGGIRALADGNLDIAVSARPLKPDESGAGLKQVAVLRTAFVLATQQRQKNGLKVSDLPRIFSADKPTWDDGSPIRIILRPRTEADSALLASLSGGMDQAIEAARKRPEVPVAPTDQDNVDMAQRTPGALIGTTLTQIKTEGRTLVPISLDGMEPTLANFESGAYPFVKKLYFFVRANGSPETQRFVDFLRSSPGVKALRAAETLPGSE